LRFKKRIKAKEQILEILRENQQKIRVQQTKLEELTKQTETERSKEQERLTSEQDETRRREDEARLLEVKNRVALEQQKATILNKNKQRNAVSFSLFQ